MFACSKTSSFFDIRTTYTHYTQSKTIVVYWLYMCLININSRWVGLLYKLLFIYMCNLGLSRLYQNPMFMIVKENALSLEYQQLISSQVIKTTHIQRCVDHKCPVDLMINNKVIVITTVLLIRQYVSVVFGNNRLNNILFFH